MTGRRATTDAVSDVSGVVYGVRVRGLLPPAFRPYLLPRRTEPTAEAASLEITYRAVATLPEVDEIWVSEPPAPQTPLRFALFRLPGGFGIRIAGEDRGLARCTPRRIGIEWSTDAVAAAHHLFSYVLPLWLEARGVPMLHGSAVTVAGRAVGFLAASGVGKSLLCAELLRLGCGFVADDGLALRRGDGGGWLCLHGPPLMRLWPSGLADRLQLAPGTLPRVRGSGDKRWLSVVGESPPALSAPHHHELAALYLLQRRADPDGPVRLTACAPREALLRLLEHGVAAAPAAALGLAGRRLGLLADVVERTPVRHLSFPGAADSAPRILAAIERDLESAMGGG